MCLRLLTFTAALSASSLCLGAGSNGPAVYYTLAKGSGNAAKATSVNENPGTVKGAQWNKLKAKALRNVKVLNNLVTELLNIENPAEDADHLFHNPREGFIFVRVEGGDVAPKVTIGDPGKQGREVAMRLVGQNYEGMLNCPKGIHNIVVRGGPRSRLIVRAIGELVYDVYGFQTGPYLPELGNYNWEWLRKHVLDSYNVIIGNPGAGGYSTLEEDEDKISQWASEGKWWTTRTGLIRDWHSRGFGENVQVQYEQWSKTPGAWHPLMKGFWVDEFTVYLESEAKGAIPYAIYNEAMQRVVNDPKFKGRRVYGFVGSHSAPWCSDLFQTILTSGGRTAREWYLFEGKKTVKEIESWDMGRRRGWEKLVPGTHSTNLIVVLGTASSPSYSYDIYPHLNWNAWLDMQMEYVATSPVFKDAAGVSGWYTSYMAQEQVRLLAQLIRHYAIEGRTDRYLADPLVLRHLTNPDFREGAEGWALAPAEGGTIAPVVAEGFGVLQSRMRANWPQYTKVDPHLGDTALLTRRSASGPNRFSQQLRHLKPGRLYSLRFYTGNYQDLLEGRSRLYPHALSVQISEGAELLPTDMVSTCGTPMQFDVYRYPVWQAARIGNFNRDNPYGWNYHQRIFRATDTTAQLTFSDWASNNDPGGEVGQELIWNFIQLQPYVED